MNRVEIFFPGFGFSILRVTCHSTFITAYNFPKNLEATYKFEVSEGWNEASSVLRTHNNRHLALSTRR